MGFYEFYGSGFMKFMSFLPSLLGAIAESEVVLKREFRMMCAFIEETIFAATVHELRLLNAMIKAALAAKRIY